MSTPRYSGCIAALSLWIMAGPALAACPGNIAFAEGRAEIPGYREGTTSYIERMVLTKQDRGIYGRWTGVEYEQSTVYPFALDAVTLGALAAAPPIEIPGVGATCQTSAIGATTIRTHCTGRFDFDMRRNGIFWAGQNNRIGQVEGNVLSLSMTPGHPFAAPLRGVVFDHPATPVNTAITGVNRHPSGRSSHVYIRVSSAAPFGGMANHLRVSVEVAGTGPDPDWTTTDDTGFTEVDIRLPGNQRERLALAGRITLVIETRYGNCPLSRRVGLDELLLLTSLTP